MPNLEQKKKQLDDLRNFYKPIEHTDLIEHSERYERVKQQKNEEIRRHREQSIQEEKEHLKMLKYKPSVELSVKQ
jgi:hypothetical protein